MSDDDYKARARKRATERNDSSWFKLKEGENTFRILRTPKSKTTPAVFYEYNIHRDVGPKRKKVRCGKNLEGEGSCWLCDVQIPKLTKAGREGRAAALTATDEMILQVAIVGTDGKMTGPKVMTPSRGVGTQIITSVLGGKRDYVDHAKGYNVSLGRTGTGKNDTRYGVLDRDDEPSAVPDSIVAKLQPFSKLKEVPVYAESTQKAAYFNQEEDVEDDEDDDDVDTAADEEDEEEEKPVKGKSKKKAAEPEDEEDDDDGEVEDEPEEKPKKAAKSKAKKAEPEPEEDKDDDDAPDDVEEDDEEDDDPPAKSKAKAKAKPAKNKKAADEEEDDDADLDEVDDDDAPDDVEEDEEDDEEEDDEPPKKAKSKVSLPAKRKRK